MALAKSDLGKGPAAARAMLQRQDVDGIEFARPKLDDLPYNDLVHALMARQGFRLDFRAQEPDGALAMIADQLLGPGTFLRERALLAEEIAVLKAFAAALVSGPPPLVAIRTYFAPGDLVWHVDRMGEAASFRLLWALGRPAGMRITPATNIDHAAYRAFMRREQALLNQLDTRVLRDKADLRVAWSHRPRQVEAMMTGDFPFLFDPAHEMEVTPGAASIHRVETPQQSGTYHRSSWDNHLNPGFQIVITASGERA